MLFQNILLPCDLLSIIIRVSWQEIQTFMKQPFLCTYFGSQGNGCEFLKPQFPNLPRKELISSKQANGAPSAP